MDLGLRGRVVMVTASSGGLGLACADRMAAEGARVVLFARSGDKLETAATELRRRHGAEVLAVAGDMTRPADLDALMARTRAVLGDPEVLVLNTARPPVPMRELLDETDDARWMAAYEGQLRSAVMLVQRMVPKMVERRWGRVVGITSATVKQPMPKHGLSTVFRAGVTGFLRQLANEVAAKGVTVNTVCPASVGTEALLSSYPAEERVKSVPMRRIGRPEELAATVAFLASDHAGFITGAAIAVDGGMVGSLI